MRKSIHFTVIILSVALVFGLVSRAPAGISDRFDQAKSYREDKQYDQAEQIYRQITAEFPDSNDALEAQKQLTCLYASTGRQVEADTTLVELTAGFSSHKDVAQAVHDIAYHYRTINRQEKANEVDQSVLSAWPQSDYAVLGQMDIARYYVDKGNDQSAQVAIDKLLRDFSGNPLIARAVHDIGQHYRWAGKYEKANRLYKHAVVNFPDTEHALWAQADLIKSYLALKDDPNTEAAIEKLVADFADNPLISRAIHDTAYEHRKLEKYDRADQLDQFVIDNWPGDEQAMWAKMDMAKTNILLENDPAVEPAIDSLIADFNDHPKLAAAVFQIGEEYYNRALKRKNEGLGDEAQANFTKAISIWARIIIEETPVNLPHTPHAWYFSAVAFRHMGEYENAIECYQGVAANWPDYEYAWGALFAAGRSYEKW